VAHYILTRISQNLVKISDGAATRMTRQRLSGRGEFTLLRSRNSMNAHSLPTVPI
jgi:hypothetical protein